MLLLAIMLSFTKIGLYNIQVAFSDLPSLASKVMQFFYLIIMLSFIANREIAIFLKRIKFL